MSNSIIPIALPADAEPLPVRDPATVPVRDVCPHCKRVAVVFAVGCNGHQFSTWHCPEHGDVVPVRSAVSRSL